MFDNICRLTLIVLQQAFQETLGLPNARTHMVKTIGIMVARESGMHESTLSRATGVVVSSPYQNLPLIFA